MLGAFAILLVWASPVPAQMRDRDLSESSLEELMNIEVYSASRHLQDTKEAPSSVTLITADDIQRYGYRTLADILRSVRGFYVRYDRNYSYLGVRGMSRPGDFNCRVLLLIDGHRLNDNIYDQAMIGTEFPLNIDLIDRVEVVRGPVSSLYGANGFFGVINVITKKGGDIDGLELSSDADSFGTYEGRITYGRRFSELEALFSGSFYGSRGQDRLFYQAFQTPQANSGFALHLDDDQLGSIFANLSFRNFRLQALHGTRDKGIPTASYGTVFNRPGTRTTDAHTYFDLDYERSFATGWGVLARLFYDRYVYQGTYIFGSSTPTSGVNPNIDLGDGRWWGGELKLNRRIHERHNLTLGGEYRRNFRQEQSNYDINPYYLYVWERRNSYTGAAYVQDEFRISKTLLLNAGFRWDYYNEISRRISPRAALIYLPRRSTTLKLVYGTAFRTPNQYELYYWAADALPNPKLKPETIRTTELVWEQDLNDKLRFSASGFYNQQSQLIALQQLASGELKFGNADSVRSAGLELELDGKTTSGWDGGLSYSFQNSRDEVIEHGLTNSPHHLAKLRLSAPLLRNKLFASLDAQYTSSRMALAGNSVRGFPFFNCTLLGRNLGKGVSWSLSVYNLLDRKYFDPGSPELVQDSIQQDGRSFRLKFTWNLGKRQ